MAGLGRRSHYRKHLTDSVLHDLPEPGEDEKIARVVATRGGNQFDICLPNDSTVYLAILPTKFHKLVWVKRGDYVLVQVGSDSNKAVDNKEDSTKDTTEENVQNQESDNTTDKQPAIVAATTTTTEEEGGIRHMISHILYKDQVKHLQSKGLWPDDDPEFSKGRAETNDDGMYDAQEDDDGIVYQEFDEDVDDDLFVNTNRLARLEIQDSSDSSDDEEEED